MAAQGGKHGQHQVGLANLENKLAVQWTAQEQATADLQCEVAAQGQLLRDCRRAVAGFGDRLGKVEGDTPLLQNLKIRMECLEHAQRTALSIKPTASPATRDLAPAIALKKSVSENLAVGLPPTVEGPPTAPVHS